MSKFFDIENPIFAFLNRLADIIILNILFIICSIPIVTIGASTTALYYVTTKMVKKEESYIWKDFFKSFKENFGQATIIWLINIAVIAVFVIDTLINRSNPDMIPQPLIVVIVVLMLVAYSVMMYVYPLLSHYENTVGATIKNAFLLSLVHLPQTIMFDVLGVLPIVIFFTQYWIQLFPIVLAVGFAGPAYLASLEWVKIFKKLDPKEDASSDEEGSVDVTNLGESYEQQQQEEN